MEKGRVGKGKGREGEVVWIGEWAPILSFFHGPQLPINNFPIWTMMEQCIAHYVSFFPTPPPPHTTINCRNWSFYPVWPRCGFECGGYWSIYSIWLYILGAVYEVQGAESCGIYGRLFLLFLKGSKSNEKPYYLSMVNKWIGVEIKLHLSSLNETACTEVPLFHDNICKVFCARVVYSYRPFFIKLVTSWLKQICFPQPNKSWVPSDYEF